MYITVSSLHPCQLSYVLKIFWGFAHCFLAFQGQVSGSGMDEIAEDVEQDMGGGHWGGFFSCCKAGVSRRAPKGDERFGCWSSLMRCMKSSVVNECLRSLGPKERYLDEIERVYSADQCDPCVYRSNGGDTNGFEVPCRRPKERPENLEGGRSLDALYSPVSWRNKAFNYRDINLDIIIMRYKTGTSWFIRMS